MIIGALKRTSRLRRDPVGTGLGVIAGLVVFLGVAGIGIMLGLVVLGLVGVL